jgi:predicted amidophosphoribosyltransferase
MGARKEGISNASRQYLWQLEKLAIGCCVKCGAVRDKYRTYCNRCAMLVRLQSRKWHRSKRWRAGRRGRRPIIDNGI